MVLEFLDLERMHASDEIFVVGVAPDQRARRVGRAQLAGRVVGEQVERALEHAPGPGRRRVAGELDHGWQGCEPPGFQRTSFAPLSLATRARTKSRSERRFR